MHQKIRQEIELKNYESARELLDIHISSCTIYDDVLAILDATVYGEMHEPIKMYAAILRGLQYNPVNYELYYMLGLHYLSEGNVDKAFLCLENALHYCDLENDKQIIYPIYDEIKSSPLLKVRPVSIVIVSYNCNYLMQKNIESIRRTLYKDSYRIVVVDNASDDGIADWLETQDDIWLIRNEENVGFAPACNQAVQYCESNSENENDIFLLNNDTRLTDNALFWLRMGLYENDKIGATGGISNYAGNHQQEDVVFALPQDYVDYGKKKNVPMDEPYEERVRLSGFALLVKRHVWDEVGGMDNRFAPGYFEDDDLSMRIAKAGYSMLVCKNSFIYHAGSQSFSGNPQVEQILLDHYKLFIDIYGFPILAYVNANKQLATAIDRNRNDHFSILVMGCALGADIFYLREQFPNALIIGVESDPYLRACSKNRIPVFENITSFKKWNVKQSPETRIKFDYVLMIDAQDEKGDEIQVIDWKDLIKTEGICLTCVNDEIRESYPVLEQIKIVIWDMDDTFWRGTLSEGAVYPISDNIETVKKMTDAGILQSISSKNDKEDVFTVLTRMGVAKYFVFADINWSNKGLQIATKLKSMGLRAENALFIDDNVMNIEEVIYYNPEIHTLMPEQMKSLYHYVSHLKVSDPEHKRLLQYRIMEQKNKIKNKFSAGEEFLYYSNISVKIIPECEKYEERIGELIGRTNQLNFTKKRISYQQVHEMLQKAKENVHYKIGCVSVKDRFTNYGIVGFFALDSQTNELEHFLFSCRILGMRVEQYVYNMLQNPKLNIVGEVAGALRRAEDVPWINKAIDSESEEKKCVCTDSVRTNKDVLLKGPCDLSAIEVFLDGAEFIKEFNYVDDRGIITTGHNHSMHIRQSCELTEEEIQKILLDAPFLSHGDFETEIFSRHFDYICYSLLPDCHGGLYRHKQSGKYITFGGKNFDLTDSRNWSGYINGSIVNHAYPFTEPILSEFAEMWEFVGQISCDDLIENLVWVRRKLPEDTTLILLLGSELEYEGNDMEFKNHAPFHRQVNQRVRKLAENMDGIVLVDANKFIYTQDDLDGCTNHFSRKVYCDMASEIQKVIEK